LSGPAGQFIRLLEQQCFCGRASRFFYLEPERVLSCAAPVNLHTISACRANSRSVVAIMHRRNGRHRAGRHASVAAPGDIECPKTSVTARGQAALNIARAFFPGQAAHSGIPRAMALGRGRAE
jgi:hypothetical protein